MGLTVHLNVESNTNSPRIAKKLVEQIRQVALDIPFEDVGEVKEHHNITNPEDWDLIQSGKSIQYPWNDRISRRIYPEHLFVFSIFVGDGCEELNIGLAKYPKSITLDYIPKNDRRFIENWTFDYGKWSDYARNKGLSPLDYEEVLCQKKVKTGFSKYAWRSFCKTQYASLPKCGGIENFIRCHVNVIKFLDKLKLIPKLNVAVNDEGDYGDYTSHGVKKNGTYDLNCLLTSLNVSQEMIAKFAGKLKDTYGSSNVVAPILSHPNFEQLEFRGSK